MHPLKFPKLAALIYSIIGHLGAVEGRTRLMKLVYLSDVEAAHRLKCPVSEARYYSYTHGPFSREVLESLRQMRGFWLEEEEVFNPNGENAYRYSISAFPHQVLALPHSEAAIAEEMSERWGRASLREVLEHVYNSEPFASTDIGADVSLDRVAELV